MTRMRQPTPPIMATTLRSVSATVGADFAIPPPAHPTYDLQHVIRLALAEDAGDRGTSSAFEFFAHQNFHLEL